MIVRAFVPLTALGLLATAAIAQDPAIPAPAERTGAIVAPAGFPWDTITAEWTERRYKVEAIRFKAHDETGFDRLGSDEVMIGTLDAEGTTVSDEIGDIDSGDTHEFAPAVSCILGVLPGKAALGRSSVCDAAGKPGPFSFKVEMWEKDIGFPPELCNTLPVGQHFGTHCLDDGSGDDFIGWRELFFPVPDLETTLPNVGDSFTETVMMFPCPPGVEVCGAWDFPDYSFTYRTTRLPDVRTDFRSQLLAAMERSGIAVAGDAVAAGLRSLRAPIDREAEREAGERIGQAESRAVALDD
jgi:hypothetical protein